MTNPWGLRWFAFTRGIVATGHADWSLENRCMHSAPREDCVAFKLRKSTLLTKTTIPERLFANSDQRMTTLEGAGEDSIVSVQI
jgi:hypothetical protein